MDKQLMAVIGGIGLLIIGIIFYAVAVFGGKSDDVVKQDFKAPEIVQNDVKTKYEERLYKQLREKPRLEKQPVLVNPFENAAAIDSVEQVSDEQIAETVFPEYNSSLNPEPEKLIKKVKTAAVSQPKTIPVSFDNNSRNNVPVSSKNETFIAPDVNVQDTVAFRTKQRYSNQSKPLQSSQSSLQASVYGLQKIYNGSLIKMRLLSPVTLESGVVIPRNTFLSGTASFAGERVKISIKSIPYKNVIYKVNLNVFDANDGLEGIYIDGGAINDVSDKIGSEVTDEVFSYPTGGVGGQVLRGIGQEAKKWARKKSVTILDEHKLLLK